MQATLNRDARKRLPELDGIRGWAALAVLLYHFAWELFGVRFPHFQNPVITCLNGRLAVAIFFVLSGEALSSGFFAGRGIDQVTGLALRRIPRLLIPIIAVSAIVFTLVTAGLTFNVEAGQIVRRSAWLSQMALAPMSLTGMISFATHGVFLSSDPNEQYGPFLWTMSIELLGSIVTFVTLFAWSSTKHMPALVVSLAGLLLLATFPCGMYADFLLGIWIAYARSVGIVQRWATNRLMIAASYVILPVGALASGLAMATHYDGVISPVIAPIVVVAIFCNPLAMWVLSGRFSSFLGKVSFPVYLVHFPVLISPTSFAIVWCEQRGILNGATAFAIAVGSIVISIAAAIAFEPVEVFTKTVGQRITRAFLIQRTAEAPVVPSAMA